MEYDAESVNEPMKLESTVNKFPFVWVKDWNDDERKIRNTLIAILFLILLKNLFVSLSNQHPNSNQIMIRIDEAHVVNPISQVVNG